MTERPMTGRPLTAERPAAADGPATGDRQQQPRILQVRTQILKKNDVLARSLRERFREAGVFVVSLVSSPGAGKTTFLRDTLRRLRAGGSRVAALVGDLATENDARRLAESGAPVRQIVTGTVCHLEADMVERALGDWPLDELDYLFVENVGNLVCPSSYDLGEDLRLVLLSTTEGEDKPLKYPTIFNTADVAVITKTDLSAAADFDRDAAVANIREVRPGQRVLEVSSKTGAGMDDWMAFLADRRAERPGPATAGGAALVAETNVAGATAAGAAHAM
jgi:hydrogenase nickel incorporation protein HypB